MSMKLGSFQVRLLDREKPHKVEVTESKSGLFTAEAVAREAAVTVLNVKPACLELFALRADGRSYLAPNQPLDPKADLNLELRLRFRVPTASKLCNVDPASFQYFFKQTCFDFRSGDVLPGEHQQQDPSPDSDRLSWLVKLVSTVLDDDKSDEAMYKKNERVTFFSNILKLASLTMMVDILTENKDKKMVLKNFEDYLPKRRMWKRMERLIGLKKLKPAAEKVLDMWLLEQDMTALLTKIEFLDNVSEFFPRYFDETFEATLLRNNGFVLNDDEQSSKNVAKVRLVLTAPNKATCPPFPEADPKLEFEEISHLSSDLGKRSKTRNPYSVTKVCTIDEICYITLLKSGPDQSLESATRISLARKNGIPIFFQFGDRQTMLAFVSALNGYYRLCEKWTFTLCPEVPFPNLEFLTSGHVHGPVPSDFVSKKIRACDRKYGRGTYLLRMSSHMHSRFYIHYILDNEKDSRPEVASLFQTAEGKFRLLTKFIDESGKQSDSKPLDTLLEAEDKQDNELDRYHKLDKDFDDIASLLKEIKITANIDLSHCLHPSEYDLCPNLLLCRSYSKLEQDIIGNRPSNLINFPYLLPFNSLCRIENRRFKGKFTNVWRGRWKKNSGDKVDVAIKQLDSKHGAGKLMDFMDICVSRAASWEDNSLIKIFGAVLATGQEPMALVMEYFALGPLNLYLQRNKEKVNHVNLVESSATLARALWYLEENQIVHSNIRCRNVFVSRHDSDVLTVKLGDAGTPDYSDPGEIHFIPIEMFANLDHKKCTITGDVWAFGTTMWQIFSYGADPVVGLEPDLAKVMYANGQRLAKPESLSIPIFEEVVLGCWRPDPQDRKSPREIMRDMNQYLYRVVNSRQVHTYLDIDRVNDSTLNVTATPSNATTESYRYDDNQGSFLQEEIEVAFAPALPPKNPIQMSQDFSIKSLDEEIPYSQIQEFGSFPGLVPTFNHMMDRFRDRAQFNFGGGGGGILSTSGGARFGSNAPLLPFSADSRSNSSLEGSLINSYFSQFTSQTSLASFSGLYSMSSIYQISDQSQLELSTEFPLGEGNFGVVYKGVLLRSNGEWDQVAVKKLKNPASSSEAAHELHRELDIMKALNHENVVKIKAVLADDGIIIMEFIREGSLDRYVHAHKDQLRFPEQFFIYAQNILDGMEYLRKQGIIHRDLAARNILVASDELVKISDFGLARSMADDKDVYVMSTQTNIPVKWLALECLKHNVYSTYSDVWSFGVVLWEMFSFGKSPFLDGCQNFFQVGASDEKLGDNIQTWLRKLEEGSRLPLPEKCPSLVYTDLMSPCWNLEPKERPSFLELRSRLDKIELQVT